MIVDLLTVGLPEPEVVQGEVELVEDIAGPFPLDGFDQRLLGPDLLPEEGVLLEDRLVHVLQLLPLEVLLEERPEYGLFFLHVLDEFGEKALDCLLKQTAVLAPVIREDKI